MVHYLLKLSMVEWRRPEAPPHSNRFIFADITWSENSLTIWRGFQRDTGMGESRRSLTDISESSL